VGIKCGHDLLAEGREVERAVGRPCLVDHGGECLVHERPQAPACCAGLPVRL